MAKITTPDKSTGDTHSATEFNEVKASVNALYTTPQAHSDVLTFDFNKSAPVITQTGAITYSIASSGNVEGVVIRHKITSNGVNTITFPSEFNVFNKPEDDIYPAGVHIFYFSYMGGDVDVAIPTYVAEGVPTEPTQDTQDPTVPTGLTSPSKTETSVNLAWNASTDNEEVTGYVIYKNNIFEKEVSGLTAVVTGLTQGTQYSFTVAAIDAAGNESAKSTALSVTTTASADTTPPSVPSGLTLVSKTQTTVDLSWTASTGTPSGYKIYVDGVFNKQVATTTGQVTGLTASTAYSFTVSAIDVAGNESAQSTALSVTTDASAPTIPIPYEYYGLRKHNPDYAGSAIAVKADGFPTLTDIGFDANGNLNTAAITALSSSATFRIAKLYGQYNGGILTVTVEANMPIIMTSGVASTFDGIVAANFANVSSQLVGGTSITAENGLTAILVAGTSGNYSSTNKGFFGKWGTTAEYGLMSRHFATPNQITILSKNSSDVQTNSLSGVSPIAGQLMLISSVWGSTDQYVRINGVERIRSTITGVRAGTNQLVLGGYTVGGNNCEQETFFRELLMYKSAIDPITDETEINTKYSLY